MDYRDKAGTKEQGVKSLMGPTQMCQVDLDFLANFDEGSDFFQAYRWAVLSGAFGLASVSEKGKPFLEVLTDKGHTWMDFSAKGKLKRVRTFQA